MTARDPHYCAKMIDLLSGTADGSLTGWKRWFTEWHVRHCPGCAAALIALRDLCLRLGQMGAPAAKQVEVGGENLLSDGRWSKVESGWDAIEQSSA